MLSPVLWISSAATAHGLSVALSRDVATVQAVRPPVHGFRVMANGGARWLTQLMC
jgi:hypothetical protein